MPVKDDVTPQKSDEAKGEKTGHSQLQKDAGEMARKAQKTEQKAEQATPIFSK